MPASVEAESVGGPAAARIAFIRTHTRLQTPPGVPEISLYLADEVTPIWEMTELELGQAGLDAPYWAFAWAGGQALARYLLDTPDVVAGARVLDLAAGSGLCGLAAMMAGAASVTCADIDPFALAAASLNAAEAGVAIALTGSDWLQRPAAAVAQEIDVVLAGDVCYEHGMAAAMVGWLRAVSASGVRVLLGDPGRHYLPAGLQQLASYDMPTQPQVEEVDVRTSAVYVLGSVGSEA
jgi:predicted nicotinamide N-methyase